jgi:hypothetical protein
MERAEGREKRESGVSLTDLFANEARAFTHVSPLFFLQNAGESRWSVQRSKK